jgi:hypothetical protein
VPMRQLSSLLRFYCHFDILRGALAKPTRHDRVDVHPRALKPTRKSPSYFARRHGSAGLKLAAIVVTRIRIILRYTRGRFALTPALWLASFSYRPVRAMAVRKCSKCCQLFRAFRGRALFVRGMIHPYFSVGPSRQREALVWLPQRAGSSGI